MVTYDFCSRAALNSSTICNQPSDIGSCHIANYTRFYYNSTKKKCQKFVFGGCYTNDNNFMTVDECQRVCINKTACPTVKVDPNPKSGCRYDMSHDKVGCPKNKLVCDVRPGKCPPPDRNSSDLKPSSCTYQCVHSDQECQKPKKCCRVGCNRFCVIGV
uniref:Uncharacterized protein n=1 Tax=Romanomermis culicivorax TaxID=13658 RepID=A0A915KQB6_ROMCU